MTWMTDAALILVIPATLGCVVTDVVTRLRAFRALGRKLPLTEMLRLSLAPGRDADLPGGAARMIRISMLARLGSYAGIVWILIRLSAA